MIDNADYSLSEADVCFLGLNYYGTCGEQGNGPAIIRQALNSFSSYNPNSGKDAFDELRICDLGDIKASDYADLRTKVLKKGLNGLPIIMGGEHLVTLPVVEKLKPRKVLIFDAHADFYDEYKGNKHSYATVTKRVSELVDEVIIAGVRDLTHSEDSLLNNSENVKLVSVEDVPRAVKGDDWYVSVDLDVLDPVYCPEVSTPIPLGIELSVLVKVLNKVCFNHKIVGLDIVELTSMTKGLSSINAGGIIMNYLKRRCE